MSRRRGWMFFALGLILALSAGAMVFVTLTNATSSSNAAPTPPPIPTTQLPVAARPLESGMKLTASDYVMKSFPLDLVPINAITQTESLDSKVLVRPIGQGETFRQDEFLGNAGAALSQQVKPGFVLFAFPIVDLMSQSDVLRDGDHVDLLVTLPLKEAKGDDTEKDLGKVTALTLQNIEVFKVLRTAPKDDKQEGAPTALMCSVSPSDAVLLKYAKDSGGTIDFALRSPADTEPFTSPSVERTKFSQLYLKLDQ